MKTKEDSFFCCFFKNNILKSIVLPFFCIFVIACNGTLPNLEPFSNATNDLTNRTNQAANKTFEYIIPLYEGAVNQSGTEEIKTFPTKPPVIKKTFSSKEIKDINKSINNTCNALSDYTSLLNSVIKKNDQRKETIDSVTKALKSTIGAASHLFSFIAPTDTTSIISAVGGLSKFILDLEAKKDLKERLLKSQEGVSAIIILLNQAVDLMDDLTNGAFLYNRSTIALKYNEQNAIYKQIKDEYSSLWRKFAGLLSEQKSNENKISDLQKQLKELESNFKTNTSEYSGLSKELEKLLETSKTLESKISILRKQIELLEIDLKRYSVIYQEFSNELQGAEKVASDISQSLKKAKQSLSLYSEIYNQLCVEISNDSFLEATNSAALFAKDIADNFAK